MHLFVLALMQKAPTPTRSVCLKTQSPAGVREVMETSQGSSLLEEVLHWGQALMVYGLALSLLTDSPPPLSLPTPSGVWIGCVVPGSYPDDKASQLWNCRPN